MAILMMLFAISMEASKVLGSSSRETIRFQESVLFGLEDIDVLKCQGEKGNFGTGEDK